MAKNRQNNYQNRTTANTTQTAVPEQPTEVAQVPVETEAEILARKLGITKVYDKTTGELKLPSTPALRRLAELRKKPVIGETTKVDIKQMVTDKYGEKVAGHPQMEYVISVLSEYVERMSPNNSVDEKEGGIQQVKLANLYDAVLNLPPEIAQSCLTVIVSVIKDNLTLAFSPHHALRFANTMQTTQEQALRFQLLTTLFMALADGTSKKDLPKVVNIRRLLEYVNTRDGKANISEFIN